MKRYASAFALITLSANAAIIDFNLSPPGTSAATGLSPLNENPAVTNSSGSGDKIPPGIVFDTNTRELGFAIGYGSFAGFTDLTGPATLMHIHGPAGVAQIASPQFNLAPFHMAAPIPATGGIILGTVTLSTNQATELMAGLYYVNIHTDLNPGGEIRGQLIPALAPTNTPPTVACPGSATVECGTAILVEVPVSDIEGNAVTVVWTWNGVPIQTNLYAATSPLTNSFVATLSVTPPLGTNVVGFTATDSEGASASCETTIIVVDTTPPVIESVSTDRTQLWPPNHKLVPVQISATVTDACGPTTWEVISVTSSQPENGLGDGNTASDWQITGDHAVRLRAERSGKLGSRIYTITIRAMDASGNEATASVAVEVPHSKAKKTKAPKAVKAAKAKAAAQSVSDPGDATSAAKNKKKSAGK